jgi:hypothetical protein
MPRRDDAAARGPKILVLSAFRPRRGSGGVPDRRRASVLDRRSRQLLREASKATHASYELLTEFAREADGSSLSQMFRLLGQMSLMQTAMLDEELRRGRRP